MGKDLHRCFSREDILIVNRYMKKCSMSLIIREMQIKTIVRWHHTTVRLAIIKTTKDDECWQRCREKGTLLHFCCEDKLVQLLLKPVWRSLNKFKKEQPYDTAIPLFCIYPKETQSLSQKDIYTRMFTAALMK